MRAQCAPGKLQRSCLWIEKNACCGVQIYAITKATLEKLALVGVINVDLQEQAMTLTKSVGEEISVKIRLQRALEKDFQALIEEQQRLRGQANKIKQEVLAFECPHSMMDELGAAAALRRAPERPGFHTGERGQHQGCRCQAACQH